MLIFCFQCTFCNEVYGHHLLFCNDSVMHGGHGKSESVMHGGHGKTEGSFVVIFFHYCSARWGGFEDGRKYGVH